MVTWHDNNETVSRQMPWASSGQHCENYDVKRETVHCYPRNVDRCCTWSEVSWRCHWNFSAFFKVCFCFNDWSLGEQWIFCFLRISMFRETKSRETLRFSGNKIYCSPRDQSLSVNCYISKTIHSVRVYCGHVTYQIRAWFETFKGNVNRASTANFDAH